MNKKISIILILTLLIITACTAGTKKSKDIDVHIGLNGLMMEFLKNTPPQKVFEGDNFPVMIKVKNNGAYNIKDNPAVLSLGFERDYTKSAALLQGGRVKQVEGISGNAVEFTLQGRSKINPNGEEEVISYNLKAGKIDPQSEVHQSTIIATLCYPYETELSSTVCVDTDINNLRPGKKVCNMQDLVFNNGQGAPIAVTKIETNMMPLQLSEQSSASEKIKPQFLIYVENRGQGTAIKNEAVKDFCTKSDASHENLNIVYLEAFLSGKRLNCQIDQFDKKQADNQPTHIKLKDKKDMIRCALEEGISRTQDSYLAPLKVLLKYGYSQSISANYLIQKPVS